MYLLIILCLIPLAVLALWGIWSDVSTSSRKRRQEQALIVRLGRIPTRCELCWRAGSPKEALYRRPPNRPNDRELFVLCTECETRHRGKSVEDLLQEILLRNQPGEKGYERCNGCGIPVNRFGRWVLADTTDPRVWCVRCKGSYPTWVHQVVHDPSPATHRETPIASSTAFSTYKPSQAVDYREYLASPEWQEKRAIALRRAGYRCQLCATHSRNLDVHHNTYERLGNEDQEDLFVLCRDCHQRFHGR